MFARDYRELARENLSGVWKLSIGTGMIACLLGGLIVGSSFFPEFEIKIENQNIRSLADFFTIFLAKAGIGIHLVSMLNLLHFILGGVIQLGYATFLLKQHDHKDPQLNDLFSKFDYFVPVSAKHFFAIYMYSCGACCSLYRVSLPNTATQ